MDESFKESQGLPANAHAKKLAKEKAEKQKARAKILGVLYVEQNGKILEIKVKENGVYSNFLGNTSKLSEGELKRIKKEWAENKQLIHIHEIEEKAAEIRAGKLKAKEFVRREDKEEVEQEAPKRSSRNKSKE